MNPIHLQKMILFDYIFEENHFPDDGSLFCCQHNCFVQISVLKFHFFMSFMKEKWHGFAIALRNAGLGNLLPYCRGSWLKLSPRGDWVDEACIWIILIRHSVSGHEVGNPTLRVE